MSLWLHIVISLLHIRYRTVHRTVHRTVLIRYRTVLIRYRAVLIRYRTVLIRYRTVHRTVHRTVLIRYRTVLIRYRAVLISILLQGAAKMYSVSSLYPNSCCYTYVKLSSNYLEMTIISQAISMHFNEISWYILGDLFYLLVYPRSLYHWLH